MRLALAVALVMAMLPATTQAVDDAEWCRLFCVLTATYRGEETADEIVDALAEVPTAEVDACVATLGLLGDQGTWPDAVTATSATGGATDGSFGPGTWIVGADIQPGTYRSEPASGACLWQRIRGFSGDLDDVIASDLIMEGPATVTISPGDAGFVADDDCGRWTKVG